MLYPLSTTLAVVFLSGVKMNIFCQKISAILKIGLNEGRDLLEGKTKFLNWS